MVALGLPVFLLASIFIVGSNKQCQAQTRASASGRTPVLVELFTSEGCSDCPPADNLLQKLDTFQPVPGAQIIVLSEHVDYWNRLGWTDPFSSEFYTQRQSAYAERLGLSSVYTPQMVVDGTSEFVGSDERRAESAIEKAASAPKVDIKVTGQSRDGKMELHVEAGDASGKSADIYLVLAQNSATSQVARGENAGRTLNHVAVAREFRQIGTLEPWKSFSKDVRLELKPELAHDPRLRAVVFAQGRGTGRVLGSSVATVAAANVQSQGAAMGGHK
ncbi:MAG TPA: DUF1223 domain-containing protein [Terriglobales bacterium]|nr:DUF1223 domain-containing protein [Terriglobales bacterium]